MTPLSNIFSVRTPLHSTLETPSRSILCLTSPIRAPPTYSIPGFRGKGSAWWEPSNGIVTAASFRERQSQSHPNSARPPIFKPPPVDNRSKGQDAEQLSRLPDRRLASAGKPLDPSLTLWNDF